ncbi:MAG: hypothetical protein U5N58_02670 [Actinomycetota bacterium]|nr:hypothetical protein [Actinomycetota bacterium]
MIVLIGATSFIGPTVLKKLLEKEYEVKCFVKSGADISRLQQTATAMKKEIILARGNLNSADTIFSCTKETEAIVYLTDLKNSYYVKNTLKLRCQGTS